MFPYALVSRDVLKDGGQGAGTVMATACLCSTTCEDFRERSERCKEVIKAFGHLVGKLIVEYVICDSRRSRDGTWLDVH